MAARNICGESLRVLYLEEIIGALYDPSLSINQSYLKV